MKSLVAILLSIGLLYLGGCATTTSEKNTALDQDDSVHIISTKELIGPHGISTSCFQLAVVSENPNMKEVDPLFKVKLIDWTPEMVDFLKNTVDSCVANRFSFKTLFMPEQGDGGYVNMYPSRAKKIIDDMYATALVTKKAYEDQVENNKRLALENKNREMAYQEHVIKLRNGTEQIQNIGDAQTYYAGLPLKPLIASPLLKPDNHYYFGEVIVDLQEKPNLLRTKIVDYWDNRSGRPTFSPVAYAFLRIDKKSVSFNPELMRIGQSIQVVGKYISNIQYRTVAGEAKVSPEIQVMYMGGSGLR